MKKIILVVLVAVLVAVGFAYAAANTVPVTGAGDGNGTISGYTVTEVHYTLDSNNPANIAMVEFKLTPQDPLASAPTTVSVQLITGGTWFGCNAPQSPSTHWTCSINNVTVLQAGNLRVVAAQ
jgi:predicted small secreted protein